MTTTVRLKQGEIVKIPGTDLSIQTSYVAHRIGSTATDKYPRSMVTATLELMRGGRHTYRAHHIVGDRFRHAGLRFRFADAVGDELTIEIDGVGEG